MKRGMTHARGNLQHIVGDREPFKTFNSIDIDQMRRPRHAKRHHRNEALAAGKNAAVERRELGELIHDLFDGPWSVISERRGLHRTICPVKFKRISRSMLGTMILRSQRAARPPSKPFR